MCLGVLMACFSRRWCSCRSAGCGLEIDDLLGEGDAELGEQVLLRGAGCGDLLERVGRSGEGADVEPVQLAAGVLPGGAGGGSVMRMSSRASQQSRTCARMRSSSRW